ncbi:MAG: hypothetical protein K0V04_33625 [Deltaproteobacteria bacterium]|nr:hypothetical protein [Deltaproteobacteria bacterium]
MTTPEQTVRLRIDSVAVDRGELRIDYAVDNTDAAEVYVFNRLPDRYGQQGKAGNRPLASLAQACLRPPSTAVMRLGPVPAPVHPGFSITGKFEPYASRMQPKTTLRATIRARLPLAEWTEYCEPVRPAEAEAIVVERVTLETDIAVGPSRDDVHDETGGWLLGPLALAAGLMGGRVYRISAGATRQRLTATAEVAALGVTLLEHPQPDRF